MKQKVLGDDITPKCSYCSYSVHTSDKALVLCEKKGIAATDGYCKKFCYDPLKRIPERPPLLDFDEQDFTL